jgi:hypothetical protein
LNCSVDMQGKWNEWIWLTNKAYTITSFLGFISEPLTQQPFTKLDTSN